MVGAEDGGRARAGHDVTPVCRIKTEEDCLFTGAPHKPNTLGQFPESFFRSCRPRATLMRFSLLAAWIMMSPYSW